MAHHDDVVAPQGNAQIFCKGAIAVLTQNKTFPSDVACAKQWMQSALESAAAQDAKLALQHEKLARIESLARAHNHPGVNVGTHALANKIVAIIEGREPCEE